MSEVEFIGKPELLIQPFDPGDIRKRDGRRGAKYDYVPGGKVRRRLLDATLGVYDWEVLSLTFVDEKVMTRIDKETQQPYTFVKPAYWTVHGRLRIPGLGNRDGIGTSNDETEDSPKGAETDSFKRCCVQFGIALDLYEDLEPEGSSQGYRREGNQSSSRQSAAPRQASPPKERPEGSCSECNAPKGKPHTPKCSKAGTAN